MADPTTVRGWLETLPEPLPRGFIHMAELKGIENLPSESSIDAVRHLCNRSGEPYYLGAWHYMIEFGPLGEYDGLYLEGYNATKSAFQAQHPTGKYIVTETWEVRAEDGHHKRYLMDSSRGDRVLIDAKELAELRKDSGDLKRLLAQMESPNFFGELLVKQQEQGDLILSKAEKWDALPTPQLDENGLLPCPFCGEKANGEFEDHGNECKYTIHCSGCDASYGGLWKISRELSEQNSVLINELWNKRA